MDQEQKRGNRVGRRAKSPGRPVRNHGLLGWGIFLAVLVVAVAPLVGLGLGAAILLAATGLVAFVLLWLLSSLSGSIKP